MPGKLNYRLPKPSNLDPRTFRCVTFLLPDDPEWYSCFWGFLEEMTFAKRWNTNSKSEGFQIAAVWDKVIGKARENFLLRECESFTHASVGAEGAEDQMIRQDPDNPCLLQTSIDGINWCTFADISKCIAGPGQPGNGTPQPPAGGGQQCYHAVLNANSTWLLPTPVNTGDIIQINNAVGASSNSHDANWHCPNGDQFFAGACIGFSETDGTNPDPAGPTGSLIINIAGTFYALFPGPFTVPAGVSNVQPTIQVNDTTISGDSGQLIFDVCVTNNQAATWTYSVPDFAITPGHWALFSRSEAGCGGAIRTGFYTSGTGWTAEDSCGPANPNNSYINTVLILPSPRTISRIIMDYTLAANSNVSSDIEIFVLQGGVETQVAQILNPSAGSAALDTGNVSLANVAEIRLRVAMDVLATNPVINSAAVSGFGTPPF